MSGINAIKIIPASRHSLCFFFVSCVLPFLGNKNPGPKIVNAKISSDDSTLETDHQKFHNLGSQPNMDLLYRIRLGRKRWFFAGGRKGIMKINHPELSYIPGTSVFHLLKEPCSSTRGQEIFFFFSRQGWSLLSLE